MAKRTLDVIVEELDLDLDEVHEKDKAFVFQKAWFGSPAEVARAEASLVEKLPGWELSFKRGFQSPDCPVDEDDDPPCHWTQLVARTPFGETEAFRTELREVLEDGFVQDG